MVEAWQGLAAGQIVDGRFEVEHLLGAGGMGQVYLVREPATGERRALKILAAELQGRPRLVGRFKREAQSMARLDHPHIARVLEYGLLPGGPQFLILEYVEGLRLDRVLAEQGGRLSLAVAVTVLGRVAAALAHAHGLGVVHRDLKPNNVLLAGGDPGAVKVIDFGLAKLFGDEALTELTGETELVGTPAFMSPEQCRCQPVTAAVDIYALGCLGYVLLAGRPPFMGETPTDVVLAHTYAKPPTLRELGVTAGLPAELERMLLSCLHKEPRARPDAAVLREFLGLLGQDLGDAAGTRLGAPTPLEPSALWEHAEDLAASVWGTPPEGGWDERTPARLREALGNQITSLVMDLARFLAASEASPAALAVELSQLQTLEATLVEAELDAALLGSDPVGDEALAGGVAAGPGNAELALQLRQAYRRIFLALSRSQPAPTETAARQGFADLAGLVNRYLSVVGGPASPA